MSKLSVISNVVKAIVLVAACIAGYFFYQGYSESQKKIEEMNAADSIYNDSKWAEAVEAYKAYIQKYPDRRPAVVTRLSSALQNLGNQKSIEALAVPAAESAKKQALSREVISLFQDAESFAPLNEISYMILCDAYIECSDYAKAREVISRAASANISQDRFAVLLRRIEQLEK